MPKFENAPNMNNPGINPAEVQADVNVDKKVKSELTPEELEKLKAEEGSEKKTEQLELSPEEQLKNMEGNMEARQQEMTRLSESIEGTKAKINETREKLGLPPDKEEPPSIFSEKDKLEKLKTEQKNLKKQKEKLISQQEKESLIREEKEKILQEKLDELFKEFEGLNPRDLESIFKRGKTPEGRNVESKSMGSLDPETAQSLAKAFKEGNKLLPKILEALPELLKKFDEDLTKEATERVNEKLEEEKLEKSKPEKELNISEDEVPPSKVDLETNPVESGGVETP